MLKASSGLVAGAVFAQPLKAAAPAPSPVTPALIEAARREGRVAFYTALELSTSERLAKAFEAKYPCPFRKSYPDVLMMQCGGSQGVNSRMSTRALRVLPTSVPRGRFTFELLRRQTAIDPCS
jgi:hypothetical protein